MSDTRELIASLQDARDQARWFADQREPQNGLAAHLQIALEGCLGMARDLQIQVAEAERACCGREAKL
jgi:hypothetical protein